MPGGAQAVRIEGLRELQRDLRALDSKLPAELRKVNLAVAQMVVAKAQAKAAGEGRMAAKAATVLKARGEQRGASVVLANTASVPFALGAEFGAGRNSPRHRTTGTYQGYNQFQPWLGSGAGAGYFLYPTIRGESDHIVEAYEKRLAALLARVFPD
jgi:hypothetical protein